MNYPNAIESLIESFAKLPSIGKKTAERLALYVYERMSDEDIQVFLDSLANIKTSVKHCLICGNMSETDTCSICADSNRDHSTIMVVESVKDLFVMEKVNEYHGVYHVLHGAISFSKGIGVDDLTIKELLAKLETGEVKELILATNATLEGETTARYLKALLQDQTNLKITRLAHGVPVGSDLQYADSMTLLKALEGRREY